MTFQDLGLNDKLLKAIADCGYDTPTPIQEQAIPAILMARDVIGLAQTGTGKTASFTLPMIEILEGGRAKARMPRSLILSPTRELAAQIAENFDTYGKYCKLSKALLVGGSSMEEQIKILERGADVLIATPGRLLDLFSRGRILLTDIKILVIDEADRMLDMGFIPDIEKIVSYLSPMRQTLLFSATMPKEIQGLAQKFLSNPKEIKVARPATTAERVEQFLVNTSPRQKKQALEALLRHEKTETAYIFCNRKRDVSGLAKWLRERKHKVMELHGDMSQAERNAALQAFKDAGEALLVCSDVAARGIDVDSVMHVFNFDIPMNADDYVHRVGRTGRAGKTGRAFSLATDADDKYVDAVEKHINMKLPIFELPTQKKDKGRSDNAPKSNGRAEDKPRHRSKKQDERPSRSSSRKDSEPNVIGFGDEVPDFFKNFG